MKKIRFREAKEAIGRSRSLGAIRAARQRIANIDEKHQVPFEFPVASELLEVYLAQKSLPYAVHRAARTYLSEDGTLQYDRLQVGKGPHPLNIFGISRKSMDAKTQGLQTPSFAEVVINAEEGQPSVTNIIHVDNVGLVVFKAFLKKPISTMAREGILRMHAEAAKEKALDETKQLHVLSDLFKDNSDVYSPRVLGESLSVVAMEYIQGDDISRRTLRGELKKEDFRKIARVLAIVHKGLAAEADYIREEFEIPEGHTANSIVNFEKKTSEFKETSGSKDFPGSVFSRFTASIDKARRVIQTHRYHDFPDVIYGDFKDENMIAMPDGRIAILDPVLCSGRKSMDIAKFGRSIVFKDVHTYTQEFQDFLREYERQMETTVDRTEIAHMLGIDMLNIIRGYLLIPESLVPQFPPAVKHVREHIDFYLTMIDQALDGDLGFSLTL